MPFHHPYDASGHPILDISFPIHFDLSAMMRMLIRYRFDGRHMILERMSRAEICWSSNTKKMGQSQPRIIVL